MSYPGPTIDAAWFPNTRRGAYWTSSPLAGNPGYAWQIVADTSGPGHCFTYAETAELAGSIAALAPRPGDLAPARQYDAATSFAPLLTCLEAGRDPGAVR